MVRKPPRHAGQGQNQNFLPAITVVIIGGGVAVYALNQDEAPFTGRKRFVLLDRGEHGNELQSVGSD